MNKLFLMSPIISYLNFIFYTFLQFYLLIKGSRNMPLPSHTMYADDIMIFCKGKFSNIEALQHLFQRYALNSGQCVNPSKSTIFAGSFNSTRLNLIADKLGFGIGSLPFIYLGVPIFKGKPKSCHLRPIADRVRLKLSAWKASLLSIAGRVQLIKSVIHGMLMHSMLIYSWPVSLIKEMECWMRNFIWSGDISIRKLVTVSWANVCKPFAEGGLGLRSLSKINEASDMKLCWDMLHSDENWSLVLRSRVLRKDRVIKHHISSSIWNGIKDKYSEILFNSSWLLGNGDNINFWLDHWCGTPLVSQLQIPENLHCSLNSKVSMFIVNGQWVVPQILQTHYPQLQQIINQIDIPLVSKEDEFIWNHTVSGSLSLKDAFLHLSVAGQHLWWSKLIWQVPIPPARSLMVWRLMHHKLPTDDKLMSRGCSLPSVCNLCFKCVESMDHLFFNCHFAISIWSWFSNLINTQFTISSCDELWNLCNRGWGPQCKFVITAAIINIINVIWFFRNQCRFNNAKPNFNSAVSTILASTSISGNATNLCTTSAISDFRVLKAFKVASHPPKAPRIREVFWLPPFGPWIKCNTDGAALGQPGHASCAGVFRDSTASFLGCFTANLGIHTAFYAELVGVMYAIELAAAKGWWNLWVETDSVLVTLAFKTPSMAPYVLRNRWLNCIHIASTMNFIISHIFREGNSLADKLASLGLYLNGFIWHSHLPSEAIQSFNHNRYGLPLFRFS